MTQENILNLMHQRTSIRSFTDENVSDEILLKIAEAGRTSPTANNKQNRVFSIVKNKEIIRQLEKAIEHETGRKDYNFFNAHAILLVSVPDTTRYSVLEVGAATQNILLAATALNLGAVWTSQINEISNQPAVRAVLDLANIPANHQCFNVIALGQPAKHPEVKERNEPIHLIE